MGVWAAEQLFNRIDGGNGDVPTALLRGPIIHRESVAPPRAT
jgi:LacI family transcriptional regulator